MPVTLLDRWCDCIDPFDQGIGWTLASRNSRYDIESIEVVTP